MKYTVRNDWTDRDETADTMLEIMSECRVFEIDKHDGKFVIWEKCDEYFCVSLTKEQLLALADEMKVLANSV